MDYKIFGDIHGCLDELRVALGRAGFVARGPVISNPFYDGPAYVPSNGETQAVFVGDYVDRGPASMAVLGLVAAMVAVGSALAIPGNHDDKLRRLLAGNPVTIKDDLQATVDEIDVSCMDGTGGLDTAHCEATRAWVRGFIAALPYRLALDGGRLIVAHAGLKRGLIDTDNRRMREFCLIGDPKRNEDGSTLYDEWGFPVRSTAWTAAYQGDDAPLMVYGHTPVREPSWSYNTVDIDGGCVFGGRLYVLSYPSREVLCVDAPRVYSDSGKPF